MSTFNGLGMHLGNLPRLSSAKTRSISPENFTGEKGKGGMAVAKNLTAHMRDIGCCCSETVRVALSLGRLAATRCFSTL